MAIWLPLFGLPPPPRQRGSPAVIYSLTKIKTETEINIISLTKTEMETEMFCETETKYKRNSEQRKRNSN